MSYITNLINARPDEEKEVYAQGLIDGATAFAWWKDGKQWLGNGNISLTEFKEEVKNA